MSRFDRSTSAADTVHETPDQEVDRLAQATLRPDADAETARRMMQLLRAGADVRASKVRRLRAAVRVKAYENQLKLSVAVDRMVRRTLEDSQESAA
jgi:hypothetical protein